MEEFAVAAPNNLIILGTLIVFINLFFHTFLPFTSSMGIFVYEIEHHDN